MFARFRKTKTRLQISLVTPRRVAGKVTQEHVGSLGSIADPASAYDRLEFWQRLHERLARFGNKMAADDLGKVMAAVHARIPMVTPAEQRELKIKTAEEAARLAQSMHDMHAETVTGTKGLIARAAAQVTEGEAAMVDLAKDAAAANDRLARLRKGEDAPAKISRPMTGEEFMKAIGWTAADLRNAQVLQQLHEIGATKDAIRAAISDRHQRAVFRRVLRERLRARDSR
jgi:hypothetical protein